MESKEYRFVPVTKYDIGVILNDSNSIPDEDLHAFVKSVEKDLKDKENT